MTLFRSKAEQKLVEKGLRRACLPVSTSLQTLPQTEVTLDIHCVLRSRTSRHSSLG